VLIIQFGCSKNDDWALILQGTISYILLGPPPASLGEIRTRFFIILFFHDFSQIYTRLKNLPWRVGPTALLNGGGWRLLLKIL
jgi:hypothetical protein